MDALKICVILAVSVSLVQAVGIALGDPCTPPTTAVAPTRKTTTTVTPTPTTTIKATTTTAAPATTAAAPATTAAPPAGRRRREAVKPGSTCIANAHCDPATNKCACSLGYTAVNGTTCEHSGASTLSSASMIAMLTFWLLSTCILK